MKNDKVVVAIYIHPEFYPPTINAILNLAVSFKEVVVVTRNNSNALFPFPSNVKILKIGKLCSPYDSEKMTTLHKVWSFLLFTWRMLVEAFRSGTDCLLLYDPIPLFSFHLTSFLISRKVTVWYHNHDMPNINNVRRFSIGWFAARYEERAMKKTDLFSLPSVDRLQYYPWYTKNERFIYLPNFPSLKVYQKRDSLSGPAGKVRIIFQGSIGEHHSLEQIIELMQFPIQGKIIELVLKGPVRENYKDKLNEIASKFGVKDRVYWYGIGPYIELPQLTKTCHIGIAIYMGKDEVSKTLGTASNKIYEYAACGIPVILYDSDQFRKNLSGRNWSFFSDGSLPSLSNEIEKILNNWEQYSREARTDFEEVFNFEISFGNALNKLRQIEEY